MSNEMMDMVVAVDGVRFDPCQGWPIQAVADLNTNENEKTYVVAAGYMNTPYTGEVNVGTGFTGYVTLFFEPTVSSDVDSNKNSVENYFDNF